MPPFTFSLISHTNAGKTTLARTLLRRDVGEVKDAPHVTLQNESHTLLEANGEVLRLWDTPGFGDTGRLIKRLKQEKNKLLWLLAQTWDRFADKPLWCSQQALKNVREEADVVLYLINAGEPPGGAAYVDQEMEILGWLGKPVLALLNQTGPPRPASEEVAEVDAWRAELARFETVRGVLTLDAFARCWVQEDHLMDVIAGVVTDGGRKEVFASLQKAWCNRNMQVFAQSMTKLAELLTASVLDGAEVKPQNSFHTAFKLMAGKVTSLLPGAMRDKIELDPELAAARETMVKALAERTAKATNELISLHSLEGESGSRLLEVSQDHFKTPERVNESIWGAMAGVAAGAMTGLWADLHAGGFTLGGGVILGGIGGGMTAYALAKGYNLVRGEDSRVHWSRDHFREQVRLALLCYLAVAHFGRGRGEWQESSVPQVWDEAVKAVIDHNQSAWDHVWKLAVEKGGMPDAVHREMSRLLHDNTIAVLRRLYPTVKIAG
ncbi:MAG: hflX 1 [Verrucomicrobiaceae bacterium]|nr:hflX 1 [Verrucomicrobiaceae bacterium]